MVEEKQKNELRYIGYKGNLKKTGKAIISYIYNDTLKIQSAENNQIVLEISQLLPSGLTEFVGVAIPQNEIEKLIDGLKTKMSITIGLKKSGVSNE